MVINLVSPVDVQHSLPSQHFVEIKYLGRYYGAFVSLAEYMQCGAAWVLPRYYVRISD